MWGALACMLHPLLHACSSTILQARAEKSLKPQTSGQLGQATSTTRTQRHRSFTPWTSALKTVSTLDTDFTEELLMVGELLSLGC